MSSSMAQRMLDILPAEHTWAKGQLYTYGGACLTGARLRAGGNFTIQRTRDAEYYLRDDPYMRLLARIIEEQFPDRAAEYVYFSPFQLVVSFNDDAGTSFADVRLVLEKAAAREDAP